MSVVVALENATGHSAKMEDNEYDIAVLFLKVNVIKFIATEIFARIAQI